MTDGVATALIGVGGTLLGTALGWILGKINVGGLKIKIYGFKSIPFYEEYADPAKLQQVLDQFSINIYNSSSENKVFSNAELVFCDKKNQVLKIINIKDNATGRISGGLRLYDDIGVVNIAPKCGVNIQALAFINNDFEIIFNAEKVYLQYQTEKFKVRKNPIKEITHSGVELSIKRKTLEKPFLKVED